MSSHDQKISNEKENSSNQSIKEMKKEIDFLRMENAYLKKLKALVQEEESRKQLRRK